MCKISSVFDIVNMGILACEIFPKMTFLDPRLTLGPTYLSIVGQIQVKRFPTQTYLGKVLLQLLLQSIAAPLDFLVKLQPSENVKKKY